MINRLTIVVALAIAPSAASRSLAYHASYRVLRRKPKQSARAQPELPWLPAHRPAFAPPIQPRWPFASRM